MTEHGKSTKHSIPFGQLPAPPPVLPQLVTCPDELNALDSVDEVIDGDANGDGVVDVQDLVDVITNWGPCPPPPTDCVGDVFPDGVVGVQDLTMVILNWS